jgi:hypothetical protein
MVAAMGLPKLVEFALAFAAAWIVIRWLSRAARDLRRPRAAPRQALDAEDLTVCAVCGAYVAERSPGCNRVDCPRPRRPAL